MSAASKFARRNVGLTTIRIRRRARRDERDLEEWTRRAVSEDVRTKERQVQKKLEKLTSRRAVSSLVVVDGVGHVWSESKRKVIRIDRESLEEEDLETNDSCDPKNRG